MVSGGKQRGKHNFSVSHQNQKMYIQFNSKPLFAAVGLLESSVGFSTAWHITGTQGWTVWMFRASKNVTTSLFHMQRESSTRL